ncbi:Heat shock protein 70 (plasmid) [Aminobacter sp. MSH1]|uniref:Hsp70 family protein n=1 Tax=Aminobacter sp. MSH1 TaxID=374606 RepID=UPI000D384DD0|nr:Hsp70 family protein [Aminobacter sp. MSH1]AWC25842.1 Heat shock protein 70 [Aminobacter sp. MSH1]
MYFGIDLGTSNSAIVGNGNGRLWFFKTAEGMDVMPSAIMIDRRGGMFVGRKAYDHAAFSPENVCLKFKRLMGTSSELPFKSLDRKYTPEEASAEILKALMAQAKMSAGDVDVDGVVITVPAAFNQMQSEATMRAAGLAGLSKVALLQEPIAAAMATIAGSDNKSGQFLIYDLGGGTFDAAIVQSISGSATVVAHAGINMLGGSDFDRAIVNSIVRPWLLDTFDLPDEFQKMPGYERLMRIANYRSELAKIALSTHENDRIFADENQIGLKDRSGQEIYLDVEISRKDLENLVFGQIDQSVTLCRKLLTDNGYEPSDLDRVIMIGGPSRMPFVRETVAFQLGIDLDLGVDPMTAVAMGAAIYAEGRDWSGVTPTTKALRSSKSAKLVESQIELDYEFAQRTADAQTRIRVKAKHGEPEKGYAVQVETDGGWNSGKVNLKSTTDIKGIPLRPGRNILRISVFDPSGVRAANASPDIEVIRVEATSDGMPLMHSIAVKVASGGQGMEVNTLKAIAQKGTPTPVRGVHKFRSAKTLRAGDGTSLEVELYEQVDGVPDPELNLPIGMFSLKADDLERGEIIRRGDEVFVNWVIDANGLMDCTIEFPTISQSYDVGYLSTAGHRNFDGEEGDALALSAINSAQSDIGRLDHALGERVAQDINRFRARLEESKAQLSLTNEPDVRRSVVEDCRALRQEINKIENRTENAKLVLRDDIESYVEELSSYPVSVFDDNTKTKMNRLAAHARTVLDKTTADSLEESQKSFNELKALAFSEISKHPGFWSEVFESMAEDRSNTVDKRKHDELVRQGGDALDRQDLDLLRSTIFLMRRNMIKSTDVGSGLISGLME